MQCYEHKAFADVSRILDGFLSKVLGLREY